MKFKITPATVMIAIALPLGAYFVTPSREAPKVDEQQCPQYSLQLPRKSRIGIVLKPDFSIEKIQPGTPSDMAGLKPGDVVTALNTHGLTRVDEVQRAI